MKTTFIAAAIAALSLVAGGAEAKKSFRFASWNIGHYAYGRWRDTRIADSEAKDWIVKYNKFLDRLGADAIGICEYSEDFTSNGVHRASRDVFGRYSAKHIGPQESWQWNAVFLNGKFKVLETRMKYYPKHRQNTYYKAVKVDLGGGRPAWFVQTHLDWGNYFPGHEQDREDQMRILIEDFKNEPRVVIAGDFNTLKWHPPAKKGGNPWETGNPEEFQVFVKAGYRLAQSGEVKTAPTHGPKLAIDNVIVRGFRMSDVSFPDCRRLSDHLPVCCTLTEE